MRELRSPTLETGVKALKGEIPGSARVGQEQPGSAKDRARLCLATGNFDTAVTC